MPDFHKTSAPKDKGASPQAQAVSRQVDGPNAEQTAQGRDSAVPTSPSPEQIERLCEPLRGFDDVPDDELVELREAKADLSARIAELERAARALALDYAECISGEWGWCRTGSEAVADADHALINMTLALLPQGEDDE